MVNFSEEIYFWADGFTELEKVMKSETIGQGGLRCKLLTISAKVIEIVQEHCNDWARYELLTISALVIGVVHLGLVMIGHGRLVSDLSS